MKLRTRRRLKHWYNAYGGEVVWLSVLALHSVAITALWLALKP